MIQFDGQKTISVYNFVNDPLLKQNQLGKVSELAAMEKELKAIIQQYVERMINDRLTAKRKLIDKTFSYFSIFVNPSITKERPPAANIFGTG